MFSAALLGLFIRLNVEYEVEHKFLLLPINGLSPSVKGKIKMSMETWLGMNFKIVVVL